MKESLKLELPSQGWRQILTARKEMLDAFDRARDQARIHEVETFHGKVAEAACRKWLSGFLPKRYGVTSGYIVSSGLRSTEKTPHFDVIIYDQLESPVLWIEDNPDSSEQGRSLAIPVEYVRTVLEVKSSFTARNVKDSIAHLGDLSSLMRGIDDPNERYKIHLPSTFCCGLVFFDLKRADAGSEAAMAAVIQGIALRGFFGGVVLRGEGHTLPHTARLSVIQSDDPIESLIRSGEANLLEFGISKSIQIAEKVHIGSMMMWSESDFAQFAFDLIAMIQGTYEVGRLSSFYGIGSSYSELMRQ